VTQARRRRPVEAIESRNRRTAECEDRVRKTVAKLAKTGLPFTVEEICRRADVGKTFIYDKKRPELTKLVLVARDTSQLATRTRIDEQDPAETASWRERALNAEARVKELRETLRQQDAHISDLTGQLFDPDGNHLADENARLRGQIDMLNQQVTNIRSDLSAAQRSLQASRANVRREQERNLSVVPPPS
jgi:chromosome segregation ATPase